MLAHVLKSGSAFAQNDSIEYAYNEKSELTNAVAARMKGQRGAILAKGSVPASFSRVFISHIAICEETESGECPHEMR